MTFEEMLQTQQALQTAMGKPMGRGTDAVKENTLALVVEAGEMLNELNWKAWRKTNKEVAIGKVAYELVDMQKFLCNIINEVCSPSEFEAYWRKKTNVNKERIKNGY